MQKKCIDKLCVMAAILSLLFGVPGWGEEQSGTPSASPTAGATRPPDKAGGVERDSISWVFVDGPTGLNKNPELDTYFPQLTVLGSKLYAAWREMAPGATGIGPNTDMQIRVAVYNGNDAAPAWKFVDGGGERGINWDPTTDAFDVQLTVFESRLYAIWQEKSKTADQIRVAVYNGNDDKPAWTFVDGGGATGINYDVRQGTGYPQQTVFASKLYATWMESQRNIDQIRVAVYNGKDTAPAWAFVDGIGPNGLNQNPANKAYNPQLTAFGSKLYLTWEEKRGYTGHIHVAVYNGNDKAPAWAFVDGGGEAGINRDAAKDASYPQMTVFGAKLYATWTELNDAAKQVRVAVYNGDDAKPAWTFVDGNGANGLNRNSRAWSYTPQLTVFGSELYATWYEGRPAQIRVAVYNGDDQGPGWRFVDGGGRTGINKDVRYDAFDPQLTAFRFKLYAAWKEKRGAPRGHRVRVAVGR